MIFLFLWLYLYACLGHRYDFEGKDAAMDSVGSGSSPTSNNGIRSVYTDRVLLSDITSNPSLGDGKVFGCKFS